MHLHIRYDDPAAAASGPALDRLYARLTALEGLERATPTYAPGPAGTRCDAMTAISAVFAGLSAWPRCWRCGRRAAAARS